jgi:hypothetical protein
MTRKKTLLPLRRPTDPIHFTAVVNWCLAQSLPVVRCSDYQLKSGPWNYYTKGTFHHDGDPKRRGMGFAAFKIAVEAWLEDEGLADALKR